MLRGLIFAARARIALPSLTCALTLLLLAAGCGRRGTARVPAGPFGSGSVPANIGSTETGIASWYGVPYHGRPSASGEIFDMEKLTAAHRGLPFQTWVEVTNLANGKQVEVRITDRGPFVRGRIIDLSMAAARQLDMVRAGTAEVRLKVIEHPLVSPPLVNPPVGNPVVMAPPQGASPNSQTSAAQYAVQVGAFSDLARAQTFRDGLPYSDTRIVGRSADPPLWRVLVGHALTLPAAIALAADIEKAAGEAMVVKE